MVDSCPILDGFWLPPALRAPVLAGAAYEILYLKGGLIVPQAEAGAVGIRWPRLERPAWDVLLAGLQAARRLDAPAFLQGWQQALEAAAPRLAGQIADFLPLLSACTGYSLPMLQRALFSSGLMQVTSLQQALEYRPTRAQAHTWQPLPGSGGQVRFFPRRFAGRAAARLNGQAPFWQAAAPTNLALGFAAGNVPGTAFLISLLAGLANAAAPGMPAPAQLVRSSRHEPLFVPWLLSIIEETHPDLVAATAIMLWDTGDRPLQARLAASAGLMLAAAGDDTIRALDTLRAQAAPHLRFHRHGHKVSFSAIAAGAGAEEAGRAALDAALWDQNGCLSGRVHFVEGDALIYAQHLAGALRSLAGELPRGATPRRFIHRAFDTYYSLQDFSGRERSAVRVLSSYEDDFAVILDRRPWDGAALGHAANACLGRTVIVRPVSGLDEVPHLLRHIPAENLQTLGAACPPGQLLELASAAGAAGVTAVRRLGQAAFPLLAGSWDGFLPLDTACLRPQGHFTSIEGK